MKVWLGLTLCAVLGAACMETPVRTDTAAAETPRALGRLEVALRGDTAAGHTYALRNAVLTVVGPAGESSFDTESDPDAVSWSRELPEGEYRLYLDGDYRLDRIEADGSVTEGVPAVYVSNNPQVFYVYPRESRYVFLQFQAGEAVADFGSVQVVLAVDELDEHPRAEDAGAGE